MKNTFLIVIADCVFPETKGWEIVRDFNSLSIQSTKNVSLR